MSCKCFMRFKSFVYKICADSRYKVMFLWGCPTVKEFFGRVKIILLQSTNHKNYITVVSCVNYFKVFRLKCKWYCPCYIYKFGDLIDVFPKHRIDMVL